MTEFFSEAQLKEYKEFFDKNGYLVIPNFVSEEDLDSLKVEGKKLVDNYFDQIEGSQGFALFSTLKQEQTSNDYFINSGDKIRFFLEEDSVDAEGKLSVPRENAINKIGHALHSENPVFRKFSAQAKFPVLVRSLGLANPVIPQAMYIFKQPKIGGYVKIHQDSSFMNTSPLSCMALWFPLEDVTEDNAPLLVVPGSHKSGICTRFKKSPEGTKVFVEPADPEELAPWSSLEDQFGSPETKPDLWVSLPCKKGSVVIIHGSVVHMSNRNVSPHSRHVFTFHMADGKAHWSPSNWLQYPEGKSFPSFEDLAKMN